MSLFRCWVFWASCWSQGVMLIKQGFGLQYIFYVIHMYKNIPPTNLKSCVKPSLPTHLPLSHLAASSRAYTGFHTVGGWNSPPPPPSYNFSPQPQFPPHQNSWNWVWSLLITGIKQQSCPRLYQKQLRGSKFKCPQTPLVGHASLHVHECAFICYYHLATILFPSPNSKSCMKPTHNHRDYFPCHSMQYDITKSALRAER